MTETNEVPMGMQEEEKEFVYPIPSDLEAINISTTTRYPMEQFYVPPRFKPFVESIALPHGLLQSRWERIAERILEDYAGETELILLVLMNGGYLFYEDLKKKLDS